MSLSSYVLLVICRVFPNLKSTVPTVTFVLPLSILPGGSSCTRALRTFGMLGRPPTPPPVITQKREGRLAQSRGGRGEMTIEFLRMNESYCIALVCIPQPRSISLRPLRPLHENNSLGGRRLERAAGRKNCLNVFTCVPVEQW